MSTRRCDRTRALISQRLDDAISEMEARAIARHTAGCAACRAFEAQSGWLAEQLRTAPLDELPRPVVVAPVRARRLPSRALGNVASIAAMVVVAVGGWAVGFNASTEAPEDFAAPASTSPNSVFGDGIRALRVDALRARELPVLPHVPPPHSVKPARPTDS
ncbi:MAG: zf-HC2 domain-containing protein [Gaiella sp.]|nr:zf-HC2 domain-containing protein [Gaiella sp.]